MRAILFTALLVLAVQPVMPQTRSAGHRAVIELTAADPEQWDTVLNNVENLRKAFSPEPVQIDVIAHGKGLGLLRKTNTAQAERLGRLANAGVQFSACQNTMRRLKLERTDLFDFARTVDSGVAEVVRKQEANWAYIKGGG
jgi:uncharacterized protein